MSVRAIDRLPDRARVWIFGAGRPLGEEEIVLLEERFPPFLERWTAHARELSAAFEVRESRFVVVAVDETETTASGCSIDALMRHVGGLEETLGVRLLDGTPVWYRAGDGRVKSVSRLEFRRLAAEGEVGATTPVFDPTLSELGDLRAGRLERAAGDSWHARLLPAGSSPPRGPTSP